MFKVPIRNLIEVHHQGERMKRQIAFALSAGMLLTSQVAASANAPVKPEAVMNHSVVRISPDGRYLGFLAPFQDSVGVALMDLTDLKVVNSLHFTQDQSVGNFWWSGPDRVVATILQPTQSSDTRQSYGELFGMNVDGSEKDYLFGYRGQRQTGSRIAVGHAEKAYAIFLAALPKHPESVMIALMSWMNDRSAVGVEKDITEFSNMVIYRLAATSGAKKRVGVVPVSGKEEEDLSNIFFDDEGLPRLAAGKNDRGEAVVFASTGTDPFWKPLPVVKQGVSAAWGLSSDVAFGYFSSAEEKGGSCLRRYSFSDDKTETLYCTESGDLIDVVLSFGDKTPIAVREQRNPSQLIFIDQSSADAKMLMSLQAAFSPSPMHLISASQDGSKLVLLIDNKDRVAEYYLFDRKIKKAELLFACPMSNADSCH